MFWLILSSNQAMSTKVFFLTVYPDDNTAVVKKYLSLEYARKYLNLSPGTTFSYSWLNGVFYKNGSMSWDPGAVGQCFQAMTLN